MKLDGNSLITAIAGVNDEWIMFVGAGSRNRF